jgi:hypothetical protein
MELITILNRCHRFRGFVYHRARFTSDHKSIEISVRPRKRSAAICSRCHQPASGYDQLPERRFEFIPLWGLSGVNYFFSLTTTISPYQRQLLFRTLGWREAPSAGRRAKARPAVPVFCFGIKRWRWESGKPVFGFPLFHPPRRRSCGNVGISPASGEISKGLVGSGGNLLLVFHAFHSPAISTALFALNLAARATHSVSFPVPSTWLSACCFFVASSTR